MQPYLRITEPGEVWDKIEFKTVNSALQRHASDQQYEHQNIGAGSSEIHNLQEKLQCYREGNKFLVPFCKMFIKYNLIVYEKGLQY